MKIQIEGLNWHVLVLVHQEALCGKGFPMAHTQTNRVPTTLQKPSLPPTMKDVQLHEYIDSKARETMESNHGHTDTEKFTCICNEEEKHTPY